MITFKYIRELNFSLNLFLPGSAQLGPGVPPPHMRFPHPGGPPGPIPPGQIPPGAAMGPGGPRPLMGLLPPGQQVQLAVFLFFVQFFFWIKVVFCMTSEEVQHPRVNCYTFI